MLQQNKGVIYQIITGLNRVFRVTKTRRPFSYST